MTQTAADLFSTSAAEIVTRTGCTVDQALTFLVNAKGDEPVGLQMRADAA